MNRAVDHKYSRFVVFCLEAYKRHKALSGPEAVALFDRFGVTEYLVDGYDVLHTLGESALINDICDFIGQRTAGNPPR